MAVRLLTGFRHQLAAGRACGLHSHRGWELVFHPSGSGTTTVAEAAVAFAPGDLVVNPPKAPHDQVMDTAGEDWCVLVEGFAPPAGLADRCWTAPLGDDPATVAELAWLTSGRAGDEPAIAGLRLQIVLAAAVARCREARVASTADPATELAMRAQRLAAERGHELAGVEELAEELGASAHWLRHACARAAIDPPLRLLTRARLARAQALLAHTAQPLAEVARQSGYRDARYLVAVFRRELGCTPGQLRAGLAKADA